MAFTTDDNSYRSSLAAADLATLLQADLSNDPGFEWVERNNLKAAERELALSQLGLQDAVGALRRGRYAAADWMVTGSFKATTNGLWALALEVTDVAHADVLATRKAEFSRAAHPTLKSALPQSSIIATEVRVVLNDAAQRWAAVRNRRSVALLMLLDAESVEAEVASAVEKLRDGPEGWRVLQVNRTSKSFGESEMILLGLVDQDRNAWEKLADSYVWGRLAVRHPFMSAQSRIPSPDYEPVLEIQLWSGRGNERTISLNGKRVGAPGDALAQLPELARRAPTNLFAALNMQSDASPSADARERIAQSLFERAKTWRLDTEHWSRWRTESALWVRDESGTMRRTDDLWVRDEIGQQVRILETASFFNPQSQGPYELLLRIDVRSSWQFTPSDSSGFWLLMKRSELWDNYVERFGFSSTQLGNLGSEAAAESIAQLYVNSAFALVDLASLGNKEERGFPRDMSGHVAKKWLAGFTTELVKRVLKTIDEPTTKSLAKRILLDGLTGNPKHLMMVEPTLRRKTIEALWPSFVAGIPPGSCQQDYWQLCESISATYAELGLTGQEKVLLEMLDKPNVSKPPTPVRLPRASELDSRPPNFPTQNRKP